MKRQISPLGLLLLLPLFSCGGKGGTTGAEAEYARDLAALISAERFTAVKLFDSTVEKSVDARGYIYRITLSNPAAEYPDLRLIIVDEQQTVDSTAAHYFPNVGYYDGGKNYFGAAKKDGYTCYTKMKFALVSPADDLSFKMLFKTAESSYFLRLGEL